MELRPVKDIQKPKYPLKSEVDPKLLKDSVPKRWTGSKAAKIALGTLAAATLVGCAPQIPTAGVPVPPSAFSEGSFTNTPGITCEQITGASRLSSQPTVSYVPEGSVAPAMLNVAPIFSHGEGRGAFGGDMASMPAFISEDEAMSIINETAKDYGLSFSAAGAPEFSNVCQPVTDLTPEDETSAKPSQQGNMVSLKADFVDKEHGIVIEFVSVEDVKKWSGEKEGIAETYKTKDAAEQLSEALENAYTGKYITAAVLYDPCESERKESEARALSEADIKAQADDFFKWLKSQGII